MDEKKIMKTDTVKTMSEKRGRCIYAAPVARALVNRGFKIIDLKPNKYNHDKTVFVFEETADFNAALEEILNEYSERKAQRMEQKRLNELTRKTFL